MLILAILCLIALIAYTIRDGMKELKEIEESKRHVAHIKAVFIHERERMKELRRSRICHWSVGRDELRLATMLEE